MTAAVATAVDRGVAFLAARQLPSGGFSLRYGADLASDDTVADDHALFGTALVAWSLGFCEDEAARPVLGRAVEHLRRHMEPGGVWRHWTPGSEQHAMVAADADDTAYASLVLRRAGVPFPDNRQLFTGNRDPDGLFYTWFVVRRGPVPRRLGLWRVGLRRALHPLQARALWRTTWA
ncbi:MAG TPA: hypothetical protein VF587_17760, partial [Solirubrobacteraceae bacterium]